MKYFWIALLVAFQVGLGAQDAAILFSGKYTNKPFATFIQDVETKTGIRIYYTIQDTGQITINLQADSLDLMTTLNGILGPYQLKASWWQGNILIANKMFSKIEIPEFKNHVVAHDSLKQTKQPLTEAEKNYLTGRKGPAVQVFTIGSRSLSGNGNRAKIRLKVLDADSGEPLVGAIINLKESNFSAASDVNGFITFTSQPGSFLARLECIGQKTANFQLIIYSDGEISMNMERSVVQIDEVFIYANRSVNVLTKEAGLERIQAKTIRELPTMVGERDIIRVSEFLPGIVSIGEGTSGINVRGGNFDQNGFYINKVPIYNTSHVFGFFPAFNPDLIRDFTIYKGHIPAEFGGRISSVFTIFTHQGNRKNFSLRGGINPVSTNIIAEGPIKKDTSSFLISIRSLYSDWILKQIKDPVIRNSKAKFNDFAFSANYDAGPSNQILVFGYYSSDDFSLSDINQYSYSNLGGQIEWRYAISTTMYTETSLIASRYSFKTVDKNVPTFAYTHNFDLTHIEAKSTLSNHIGSRHKIDAGFSSILYKLNRGAISPYGEESLREAAPLGKEMAFDASLFFAEHYKPAKWLNLYAGFRYNFFAPLGESNVYEYMPNTPRSELYVVDTLSYGKFKPIKWYHGPEVRVSATLLVNRNLSLKLAFNQTRQNLFMLNNTITIAPNPQWKLSDYHLKPSLGKQLSFGFYQMLPKLALELSLEIFLKETQNQTEFKDGAGFTKANRIETMVLQGNQEANGFELMIKKPSGRFNGWLAYTYSKTTVIVDGMFDWEKINTGLAFPSNYDIPHVVNLVSNYRFSRRFNIATTVTYQTGRPITYPLSVYYAEGMPVIDYSSRNQFRIPHYLRMDISLAFEGNLKKEKLFHSSWMLGIYNLTGRKNPLSIYFKSENGRIKGYKYSIIGTPIMTLTWLIKLGNYAS
jgi:hypothetical protein